jgi:hypothetical protein
MSQDPSDIETSQNENNSPVAIRKLRSGRKMNTPSSHSKRRRGGGDDDYDSRSDASKMNDDDVEMDDSSDGGRKSRSSIKVRRRLIHTLDVLVEQEPQEDHDDDDDDDGSMVNAEDKHDEPKGSRTSKKRSKRKISDVGPHPNLQTQSQEDVPKSKKQNTNHSQRQNTNITDNESMEVEPTSIEQDTNLNREEQIQQILNNAIRLDDNEPTVIASPMITTRAPSHRPPTVPRTRRKSSGSHIRHGEQEVDARDTTTRQSASPARSTSDVDSEVEHLHLHMPKREEVEMEEREEGRRDGLFHKYFNISSDSDNGRIVAKLSGLVFILHLCLTLLLVGNNDFSVGIPYWTFLSPFCTFVNLNKSARLVWMTYERWGLLEAPTNVTADIIQKERVEEDLVYESVLVDNLELENEELELRKTRKQMESFVREQNELKKTHEAMQMAVEQITGRTNILDGTSELSDQQASIRQQLLDYKQKLDSTMKELSVVEKSEDKPDSISIESLINLDTFDFFNPSLNLMHFNDINIPGETCVGHQMILHESEEDTQYATKDDIQEKLNEYTDAAIETYQAIHNDHGDVSSKFIIDWMNEVIDSFSRKYDLNKDIYLDNIVIPTMEEPSEPISILTTRKIKEMVAKRIEIERADRTGKHDYAALRSEAQIIRSGSRRTSPSLIETLPLINQLLSALGLRFYGHGAYAALEPTHPTGAMGQCWSFSKESEMTKIAPKLPTREQDAIDGEPNRGKYATLAIKLASPIWVESIVIEHPYDSTFSNRDTAVRNFRVYGFQDEAADGEAWFLGEFEYLSESDEANQEFEVETESEDGQEIPPLSSIVLAVDSNWGADYSCLYRFKVHGELANDD